jgi:opacity protein-like surface antigen
MKKTLIGLFMAMFWFGAASAEVVSIGVSGNAAIYAATATELDTGTHGTTSDFNESTSRSEFMGAAYGSVFVEAMMGPFFIGLDYVPGTLSTEESTTTVGDKTTSATSTQVTNTVKVDFEDMNTIYAGLRFNNAFIKMGATTVELLTKESLGTGSTYGDTTLDGAMVGAGVDTMLDNGIFIRAEANYTDFDGVSLTSSSGSQKITLDNLDGLIGKISIGKTF